MAIYDVNMCLWSHMTSMTWVYDIDFAVISFNKYLVIIIFNMTYGTFLNDVRGVSVLYAVEKGR